MVFFLINSKLHEYGTEPHSTALCGYILQKNEAGRD